MRRTRFTNLEVTGDTLTNSLAVTNGIETGSITLGVKTISKGADYELTSAERQAILLLITATAGSKTITLGGSEGQLFIVKNAGATAFTLKNIAGTGGDTGTTLTAGKSALVVCSETKDKSTVIALD